MRAQKSLVLHEGRGVLCTFHSNRQRLADGTGADRVEVDAIVDEPVGMILREAVDIDEGEAVALGDVLNGSVERVKASGLNAKGDGALGPVVRLRSGRGAENEARLAGEGEVGFQERFILAGEGVSTVPGGGVVGAKHENDHIRDALQAFGVGEGVAVRIGAACHGAGATDAKGAHVPAVSELLGKADGIAFAAIAGGIAVADTGHHARAADGCRRSAVFCRRLASAAAQHGQAQAESGAEHRLAHRETLLSFSALFQRDAAGFNHAAFQLAEGSHRRRMVDVVADDFFHPDHVVPAAKLVAAAAELAHNAIAHVGVEVGAVAGEVGVVGAVGHTDAGLQIEQMLSAADRFQSLIEGTANAVAATVFVHIDGGFRCPVVGRAAHKRACVSIAQRDAAKFRHQIRIARKGVDDATAKLGHTWHRHFEGDGGVGNIRCINGQKRLRVVRRGRANGDIVHRKVSCFLNFS